MRKDILLIVIANGGNGHVAQYNVPHFPLPEPVHGLNEVFVEAVAYAFSRAGAIGIAGSLICQSLTGG